MAAVQPDGPRRRDPAPTARPDEPEWLRPPQQRRSRETLDLLLDATEELLADREFEEITVRDIVARAGRTIGSFYGRLGDKEAALLALSRRNQASVRGFVDEYLAPQHWEDASLEDVVRGTVELAIPTYRGSERVTRAVLRQAVTDTRFRDQRVATVRHYASRFVELMCSRGESLRGDDPVRTAELAIRHVLAVLDHELLFGPVVPARRISDRRLVDELTAETLLLLRGC